MAYSFIILWNVSPACWNKSTAIISKHCPNLRIKGRLSAMKNSGDRGVCQGVSDLCIGGPQRWLVVAVIHTESCIFRCKYVYTCVKTTHISYHHLPCHGHIPQRPHILTSKSSPWCCDFKMEVVLTDALLSDVFFYHSQDVCMVRIEKWHMACGVLAKQNVSPLLKKKWPKISKHHWAPRKVHLRSGTIYHILKKWYMTNDAKYLNDESW